MKKSQEIIGLPVFSIVDGKKLGQVEDLVINPEGGKVDFVLVRVGSGFTGVKVLPFPSVMGIGEDALTIESENQLGPINENADAFNLLQRNITVIGTRILSNQGNFIGVISEYAIDEQNGSFARLDYNSIRDESKTEVIDGADVITYGAEVVVVKAAGQSAQVQADDSMKDAAAQGASDSTALFKERQRQFLIGKKVIQDIKDADGSIIIPEGTVVTEETCNLAESKGKFVELSQCAK